MIFERYRKHITKEDFKRTFPQILLLFLICCAYNILRNLKDAVTLPNPAAGAEVIDNDNAISRSYKRLRKM